MRKAAIVLALAVGAGPALAAMITPPGVQPLFTWQPAPTAAQAAPAPGSTEEPLAAAKLRRVVGAAVSAADKSQGEMQLDALFNYPYMARWAAGRLDRALDDQQRDALLGSVRRQLLDGISTYLGIGAQASEVNITVMAERSGRAPGLVTVPVELTLADSGNVMLLEFHMSLSQNGWKAYDVSANGASAVAFYRQFFGDLIRRHGPEVLSP